MKKSGIKKRKINGTVVVCVKSSFNNTITTACELSSGKICAVSSGGSVGYKNTKKSTPFAAQLAAESLTKSLVSMGVKDLVISFKGFGPGRESVIRTFGSSFNVLEIRDRTPIAYNGVRQPKRRRS